MHGNPGSLTMYSTADRGGLIRSDDKLAGPADYNVTNGSIRKLEEKVAPFDTTAKRIMYKPYTIPGPDTYFPEKLPRDWKGTPKLTPDFFPAAFRRGSRTSGPGPIYKPIDQITKMMEDAKAMATKKPRVNFEKHISNACPTIYHPQDIRCFVEGADGRMYPWMMNRRNKTPGPKYNTFGVQTSRSKSNPPTDFSKVSKRPSIFKSDGGFGPADFFIPRTLRTEGGVMLGKTGDPKQSSLRYFDQIQRKSIRDHIPHPFSYYIPSCFDKVSPKAVSAPFKSKTKLGCGVKVKESPSPNQYFKEEIPLTQVTDPKICGIVTFPPTIKSFNSTEPRFFTLENNENELKPPPWQYTIKGFTDELQYKRCRHRPAIRNPKEGFLISSERPDYCWYSSCLKKTEEGEEETKRSPRREWRNIRPKKGVTYSYFGRPPPDTYVCRREAVTPRMKRFWARPRNYFHGVPRATCTRKLSVGHIDMDIPGPGKYYSRLPAASGGKLSTGRVRFPKTESIGPGPCHKLHDKYGLSIWRATHLGTFNSKLKQIGISYPNAGGFHAKNLDTEADKAWRIDRKDFYDDELKNSAQTKCMEPVLKVVGSCEGSFF